MSVKQCEVWGLSLGSSKVAGFDDFNVRSFLYFDCDQCQEHIQANTQWEEWSRPQPVFGVRAKNAWAAVPCLPCLPFKADSHICCAAYGLECIFPIRFTQCSHAWFTLAMPHPCHALTMPFLSSPRHSTTVERRPVGYLPAFGFFRLPCGVPRRLLSEAYQSSSQRSIPTIVKSGSSTLQKRRSVKLLDQQFGYFRLPHRLWWRIRHCRSRAGAWRGTCELTARHGHCLLRVNRPLQFKRQTFEL